MLLLLTACVIIGDQEWSERIDLDQDGVNNSSDCAPNDPEITIPAWWRDDDGDGVGGGAGRVDSCEPPEGYVVETGDCDDADASVYPGAVELCDGLDNDCNGTVDDAEDTNPWYTGEVCRLLLAEATTVLHGEEQGDNAGQHISHALDHDGDGIFDVFVGAPLWGADAGRAYLLYGPLEAGDLNLGGAEAIFQSQDDDRLGRRLAAGDLDGDGADELAVTALRHTVSMNRDGAVFVFAGGERLEGIVGPEQALATISGAWSWSRVGFDVAFPGDLSGDDVPDLLVSSVYDQDNLGVVYLMAGPIEDATVEDAYASVAGVVSGAEFGTRLHPVQDQNGDGEPDLVLPDPEDQGVWLFYGPLSGMMDTDDADVEFIGDADSSTGNDLCSPGDWSGDGLPELLIGAPSDSAGGDRAGAVYLVPGSSAGGLVSYQATAVWVGEDAGDNAGHSLNCDGDVDGDGVKDQLVGANHYGANDPGTAYLVYGFGAEGVHEFRLADARFEGGVSDEAGSDVVITGDTNGSGGVDLLVSMVQASSNGSGSGALSLISADWSE